jgi:cbb3-type cytochrome oxidase subunit 3
VIRSINPDWVVWALGLMSVYILYQIYFEQHEVFWYMVIFAVVAFGAYIVFRKQIKGKYNSEKYKELGDKEQIERAVGHWMKLYYCSTDNIVFGWKKGDKVPLDQMNQYLMKNSVKE